MEKNVYLTSFRVEMDDVKWRNPKGNVDGYE